MIIVGVDAGATKTRAVAYDCEGNFIGEGLSGPGNYQNVGLTEAIKNIKEAISLAVKQGEPNIVAIGAAGLDSRFDWETFSPLVSGIAPKVIVQHDGVIALFAETLGGPGVVVIAGTGSVVEGFDGKQFIRLGGREWLLSDEGSAYWVGREALRKVLRMMEGIEKKTLLYDKVLSKIRVKDIDEFTLWVYRSSCKKDLIASISITVDETAREGDETALEILRSGAEELANLAIILANRIGTNIVYLKGGMFNSQIYRNFFISYLNKHGLKGEVGKRDPVFGALVLGFKEAGCDIKKLIRE